ncbi:hypothetical protein ACFFRU_07120 [Planobispora longispora]
MAALKDRFVAGHGVRFRERVAVRSFFDGRRFETDRYRLIGAYRFGRSGVKASRMTYRIDPRTLPAEIREVNRPVKFIMLRRVMYIGMKGLLLSRPRRTAWFQMENPGVLSLQMVNVLEPATLRGLLATTRRERPGGTVGGVPTTLYRGTITARRLYGISRTYRMTRGERPRGPEGRMVIGWRLWQDAERNTRKLVVSYADTWDAPGIPGWERLHTVFTSTTRFSGWGARVRVKAPPAHSVLNFGDPALNREPMALLPQLPVPLPGLGR